MRTKVAQHQDVDIYLDEDGKFAGTLKIPAGTSVTDKTLAGIKRKIDDMARDSVRAQASNIPATVLVREGRWSRTGGDVTGFTWYDGKFIGVNAHTGQVTLELEGGKRLDVSGGHFFRAEHPELGAIRQLIVDFNEAERILTERKNALEQALEQHGYRPRSISQDYGQNAKSKTEQAAKVEERIVQQITPPQLTGGPSA